MSELTPCNFCTLKRIKARARKSGKKVTVIPDPSYPTPGYDVFIHPKSTRIKELSKEDREDYFSCWMMEIPEKCCC